ncbi:predicted protein [Uncinocarpus reesii 1704]|uniref:Uncharacterized protein n=1 Tax=Uncinocarpus reesii (strain UAMH 1704) TaxID=336963 RepID=C4JDW6_UNCRE|nr:uncharacterized protein UREG_00606 [Uncinocarpus reesii 1704]EEP75759.1 predicted protein [Uncinocarpus reesii 1704]
MGTRSVICIWYKGRFVVAQYTQFDGYPEGQGIKILKFLAAPGNVERLKAGLEHVKIISEEEHNEIAEKVEEDTRAKQAAGAQILQFDFSGRSEFDRAFPSLSRLAGGRILELVAQGTAEKPTMIYMDLGFVNDALFCEWAYCVDLDSGVFEVFGGGTSKEQSGSKRFQDVGEPDAPVPRLVKSFSFDNLPKDQDEFIDILNVALEGPQEARDGEQVQGQQEEAQTAEDND